MNSATDLSGLIEFLANISLGLVSFTFVTSLYYLFAFGAGISKLGGTSSMYDRPPEPKLVIAYLVGAVLFGSFTYMLGVSYMTVYQESAFTTKAVWEYAQTAPQASANTNLAAILIRSVFQIMAVFFLYGSFSKAVDAGRSDGRERGALTNSFFKLFAAILLWTPEKTVSFLNFIPFFDVFAALLSGAST